MADVTITTDTAELFSHDVYFEFVIEDTTTATYDTLLLDMGKLKYTFDIPNDGEDTTAVGLKAGSINVEVENFCTSSSDLLIDIFNSSFTFDQVQTWVAKMYWRERGGTYGNPILFDFNQTDVNYDKISEKLTLSLHPKSTSGLSVQELGELVESEVSVYRIDGLLSTDDDGILMKEYVLQYLYQTFVDNPTYPMTVTPIYESSVHTTTGNPSTGDEWYVVIRAFLSGSEVNLSSVMISSDRLIGLLASLDGSIYGSALGTPFYVSRSDVSNAITLNTDSIQDVRQEYFHDAKYRNCIITQDYVNGSGDDASLIVEAQSKNEFAEKNINIRFQQNFFGLATLTTTTAGTNIEPTNAIISEGLTNYQLAFSFDRNKKASVTYWGIDGIFPYSVINFDANAPDFVKNRDFRVKEIQYDFKGDKVMMEIYEI